MFLLMRNCLRLSMLLLILRVVISTKALPQLMTQIIKPLPCTQQVGFALIKNLLERWQAIEQHLQLLLEQLLMLLTSMTVWIHSEPMRKSFGVLLRNRDFLIQNSRERLLTLVLFMIFHLLCLISLFHLVTELDLASWTLKDKLRLLQRGIKFQDFMRETVQLETNAILEFLITIMIRLSCLMQMRGATRLMKAPLLDRELTILFQVLG